MERVTRNARSCAGFTLVELLVVITVIVVLLALLAPALDKAVYQAELAVCGARLRMVGEGVSTYAFGHRRHYPYRSVVDRTLATPMSIAKGGVDDRPTLRRALPLEMLHCPLTGEVDLDYPDNQTWIYSSYNLYFAWRYVTDNDQGMNRIGDRWTYTEASTPPAVDRFRLLAGDIDVRNVSNESQFGSHPDSLDVLFNVTINKPAQDQLAPGVPGAQNEVFRRWQTVDRVDRGTLDLNYVYDDGSVQRLVDVPEAADPPQPSHPRTAVAEWNNKSNPLQKNYVPRP